MSHLFSQWSYWGPLSDWTVDRKLLKLHNTPGELYMTGMESTGGVRPRLNVHVTRDDATSIQYGRIESHINTHPASVEADLDRAMTFSMVTPFKCIPLVAVP